MVYIPRENTVFQIGDFKFIKERLRGDKFACLWRFQYQELTIYFTGFVFDGERLYGKVSRKRKVELMNFALQHRKYSEVSYSELKKFCQRWECVK